MFTKKASISGKGHHCQAVSSYIPFHSYQLPGERMKQKFFTARIQHCLRKNRCDKNQDHGLSRVHTRDYKQFISSWYTCICSTYDADVFLTMARINVQSCYRQTFSSDKCYLFQFFRSSYLQSTISFLVEVKFLIRVWKNKTEVVGDLRRD